MKFKIIDLIQNLHFQILIFLRTFSYCLKKKIFLSVFKLIINWTAIKFSYVIKYAQKSRRLVNLVRN